MPFFVKIHLKQAIQHNKVQYTNYLYINVAIQDYRIQSTTYSRYGITEYSLKSFRLLH